MTGAQLYRAFPIKDFGLVGWAEVQTAYQPFEYLFGFELLESIMVRGGFELKEWIALKSGDEAQIKAAFNWYSSVLLGKRKTKGRGIMAEGNAVTKEEAVGGVSDQLGLKVIEKIEKFGGGTWELLHKESSKSDGWAETTKAMEIQGLGVVIKITCSRRDEHGVTVLATSSQFVPGVAIVRSTDNAGVVIGRTLVVGGQVPSGYGAPATNVSAISKGKRKGKKAGRIANTVKAAKPAKPAKVAKPRGRSKKKHSGRGRPKGSKNKPK